jgi:protein-tyrosine phosphatase
VASDSETGFALYRSGRLSPADLEVLCGLGVEEILVLDGEGAERECQYQQDICPGLRVRYDFAQEEDRPVSLDFLQAFDAWIEEAQTNGTKVALRCRHGWHRTGRLIAYYRMRFEGVPAAEAIREMQDIGHMMWRHPTLNPQVEAYEDIIAGRPCTSDSNSCPLEKSEGGLVSGVFSENACETTGTL